MIAGVIAVAVAVAYARACVLCVRACVCVTYGYEEIHEDGRKTAFCARLCVRCAGRRRLRRQPGRVCELPGIGEWRAVNSERRRCQLCLGASTVSIITPPNVQPPSNHSETNTARTAPPNRFDTCWTISQPPCTAAHSEDDVTSHHVTSNHVASAQRSTLHHSTLHHLTAPCSTAPCSTAQHSTAQHSTAQHSTTQRAEAQYSSRAEAQYSSRAEAHPDVHLRKQVHDTNTRLRRAPAST